MLARRGIPGLACIALLASCSSEKSAPNANATSATNTATPAAKPEATAEAAKAAPGAAKADAKPAAASAAAALNTGKPAPAGAAAAAPAAPMTPAEKAAAEKAEREKRVAEMEKRNAERAAAQKLADTLPLLGAEDPDDVVAAFPARKRPKEPLPEELQKQIRGELRDAVSKAPIVLRDTLYLPREDGSAEVLAIYQMSVYEDCMARHPGSRRKARAACLPEKSTITDYSNGESEESEVELNTECLTYGVVHASLAARTAEGERLKVSHLALPEAHCRLTALKQFFLDDVDRDGRPELVIAATVVREVVEAQRRTSSVVDESEDLLWVLDVGEALTEQLQLSVSRYSAAARTVWVDLNRDERADLVQIEDCRTDDMYDEEDRCAEVLLPRIWRVYDPALDRWEDDEKVASDKPAADKPTEKPAADKAAAPDKPADKPASATPAAGGAQ